MDPDRFDTMTRFLHNARSRRRALVTLLGLGGTVGISLAETAAAKKKKSCPPCKKRKQGKCKKKRPDGTACAGGTCQGGRCIAVAPPGPVELTCVGQPDGTRCAEGKECSGEVCAVRPDCFPTGIQAPGGDCTRCCSGICPGFSCSIGGPGDPCTVNGDCFNPSECVGFVCQ